MGTKTENFALQTFGLYWLDEIKAIHRNPLVLPGYLLPFTHSMCTVQDVYGERLRVLAEEGIPLRYVTSHPAFSSVSTQASVFHLLNAGLQHCFEQDIEVHDALVTLEGLERRPSGLLLSICCSSALYVSLAEGTFIFGEANYIEPLHPWSWFDAKAWDRARVSASFSDADVERFFTCVAGECRTSPLATSQAL